MLCDDWTPGPPVTASPDDPIVHGARWKAERDEARAKVERLREALRWYIAAADNDRGEMSPDAQEIADDAADHARHVLWQEQEEKTDGR